MNSLSRVSIGLIVNPIAGIGGAVALKGSDGENTVQQAIERGAIPRAAQRVGLFLDALSSYSDRIDWFCWGGSMGEQSLRDHHLSCTVVGAAKGDVTHASDTIQAAQALKQAGVDMIVFAGGDGTARDMVRAVGTSIPVLGIPAGVKIHSGVYAVHARGAAEIIAKMLSSQLVSVGEMEVRDIDEEAFRNNRVQTTYFGELLVTAEERYLQHVKCSGREVEALALQDIAAFIIENLQSDHLYILGPGTSTRAITLELGLPKTLLGVDLLLNGEIVQLDATEQHILIWMSQYPATIVVTLIGGQGHIFGRGNHQISPAVIRAAEDITIVATKSKIRELQGRPLLVDTWDADLNAQLKGFRKVVTGFEDSVLYAVEG
ncbi:MAG: ATP-NAD kinase [Ketobacter sp.]|nr:MAG: ATP-NAD kinase [Ketobacter sp.]